MSLRSIRVRLTAWYTAVVGLVLVAMVLGIYSLAGRVLERRTDLGLLEVSNTILSAAGPRADRIAETVRRFRAPDRRLMMMTRDGRVIAESEPVQFREFIDPRVFTIQPTDSTLLAAVQATPGRGWREVRGRAAARARGLASSDEWLESNARRESARFESDARFESHARLESEGRPRMGGLGAGGRPRPPGPVVRAVTLGGDAPVRALVRPLPQREYVLVMLGSAREHGFILRMLRNALIGATLVALVLAAAPGYFLARRSLAPVSAMSRRAAQIGAGNLDERLPVVNPHDELGELSQVLNDLLDRLQRAFEQQRRFMAEAAHELRTPVAVVRAESELALSKGERSGREYRDALGVVGGESRRMSRIVDDLLTLSRAESGEYPLRRMPIELDDLLARTARSLRVRGEERDVPILVRSTDLPPMNADADLLQRMLTNLVDNAIRHARQGSEVRIEAWPGTSAAATDSDRSNASARTPVHASAVTIRIVNFGAPIEPDARTRIFEPFYRGEVARADGAETGAGLGLPIAQWIARAHAGELRLLQADGNPTVFEVVLPVGVA